MYSGGIGLDTRSLILFIYLCVFVGGGIGIKIVRDRILAQADERLPTDAKIRHTIWSRSGLKTGEMFRAWRVHRQFFPDSPLPFLYIAVWVFTLSWMFFGLNLLQWHH